MAREIVWTIRAGKMYESQVRFLVREWGEKVAQEFIDRIEGVLEILTVFPQIGKAETKRDIRAFVVSKHVTIFYRFEKDKIFVLNLFDNRFGPERIKY